MSVVLFLSRTMNSPRPCLHSLMSMQKCKASVREICSIDPTNIAVEADSSAHGSRVVQRVVDKFAQCSLTLLSSVEKPLAGSLLWPGCRFPDRTTYGVPAMGVPPTRENAAELPSPVAARLASISSASLRSRFSCLPFEMVLPWKLHPKSSQIRKRMHCYALMSWISRAAYLEGDFVQGRCSTWTTM